MIQQLDPGLFEFFHQLMSIYTIWRKRGFFSKLKIPIFFGWALSILDGGPPTRLWQCPVDTLKMKPLKNCTTLKWLIRFFSLPPQTKPKQVWFRECALISGIVRRFGTAVKGNIEFPSRHATHDKLRKHLLKRSISDKIKFNDNRLGIVFEPFWHNDSVTWAEYFRTWRCGHVTRYDFFHLTKNKSMNVLANWTRANLNNKRGVILVISGLHSNCWLLFCNWNFNTGLVPLELRCH